jgi:hypothetical protein
VTAESVAYVQCDWRNPVPGALPYLCTEEIRHVTQAKARKEAREAGWTCVPHVLPSGRPCPGLDKHYCPAHKPPAEGGPRA